MTQVVIDPGVLVSAFISPKKAAPALLVDAVFDGHLDVLACPALIAELTDVLGCKKFAKHSADGRATAFIAAFRDRATMTPDPPPGSVKTADPEDDYLLALAEKHDADAVVSGDPHLLDAATSELAVLTPRELAYHLGFVSTRIPANAYEIRIVESPLAGRAIRPYWASRAQLPTGPTAIGIQNWDFFDGAIVGVAIADPNRLTIYGSGVMVAPGVVLTASHSVNEYYDAVRARERQLHCIAIRQDGRAELWTLRRWIWPETKSDISFLNVELCTAAPEGWSCACLPISTRAPAVGETVSVIGFRFDVPGARGPLGTIGDAPIISQGGLYVATGQVQKLWYPQRDPIRISFPAIQIGCSTLGGMSGGPVLDQAGNVIGILSTGMETLEGDESYAAWILHAFMFKLGLVWPPGLYSESATLLDLPDTLVRIVGRNKVELTSDQEIVYEYWH